MKSKSVPSVPNRKRKGNTRPSAPNPAKKWVFTLNNYSNEDITDILNVCSNDIYIFQEEIGEKKKTPHLQGMVIFEKKCRPIGKFKSKKISWRLMKGTPQQALVYCIKEFTRKKDGRCWYKNIPEKWDTKKKTPDVIEYENLYDWQKQLVEIVRGEISKRIVYWIWESIGNAGKTELQKHLHVREDAIILSGRRSDIKNGLSTYVKINKRGPKVIVINIPRDAKVMSWAGIEEIKDGFFFSPKYEGGMVFINQPHVLIFSNSPPPETMKLSEDKLKVFEIVKGKLVSVVVPEADIKTAPVAEHSSLPRSGEGSELCETAINDTHSKIVNELFVEGKMSFIKDINEK